MGTNPLTHSELLQLVMYEPHTGLFFRRKSGEQMGWDSGYYLRAYVKGKKYYLHRLAWFYVTGEWPELEIDHINGDKFDNRFDNLRQATRSQNRYNTGVRKDSRTGVKGVEYIPRLNNYRAVICIEGVKRRLGHYDTAEEAGEVYREFAKHWQKEYAHGG